MATWFREPRKRGPMLAEPCVKSHVSSGILRKSTRVAAVKMPACRPEAELAQLLEGECLCVARSAAVVSLWLVAQAPREICERALRPFLLTREKLAEAFAA